MGWLEYLITLPGRDKRYDSFGIWYSFECFECGREFNNPDDMVIFLCYDCEVYNAGRQRAGGERS